MPTPAELQGRIDDLKGKLAEAELKAKSAALDTDYIQRVQKQYETYYEKVFNTQITIVTVISIFISVVLWIAAKFSIDVFNEHTKNAVAEASNQIRTQFDEALNAEVEKLKISNAADVKGLDEALSNRISQVSLELGIRSEWSFKISQALAAGADERFEDAKRSFRAALQIYKNQKHRNLIDPEHAGRVVGNILLTVRKLHPENSLESIRHEIADSLYDNLDEELAYAAERRPPYAKLIRDRKLATSHNESSTTESAPLAEPGPAAASPAQPASATNPPTLPDPE